MIILIFRAINIIFVALILLGCRNLGYSQLQVGLLPSININHTLAKGWETNGCIESRISIYSSRSGDFDYLLSDASLFISRTIGADVKLSFGYLQRFNYVGNANRFSQQLSIIQPFAQNRIAHRLVLDQTFYQNEPNVFRLRYRLGTELSLSGSEINVGEAYVKLTSEIINIYSDSQYDLEIRVSPSLGVWINNNNKIEFGLDGRTSKLIHSPAKHTIWTSIRWYLKF